MPSNAAVMADVAAVSAEAVAEEVRAVVHEPGLGSHTLNIEARYRTSSGDDLDEFSEAVSYTHLTLPTICSV